MHNLSKNLAQEWVLKNVRVNGVVLDSSLPNKIKKCFSGAGWLITGHTPMKRFGETRQLMGATLLLVGPPAPLISGSEIVVDGGYHAMTI
ncbi:MAG: SDR family oxidoreductase [Verrucomicrobia bacterium]|nr:SDR family oxidoreductase [Verrucomicrobiota bacterium]